MTEIMEEPWYRLNDVHTAGPINGDGDFIGPGSVHIGIQRFPVIRHTLKGVWLEFYGKKKFVLTDAKKHFACATYKEARASYRARKVRHRSILKAQLKSVETLLTMLEREDD